MSPKSCTQFYQERIEISRVQVRCPESHRQTELVPEVTPAEVGHLKLFYVDTC